VYDATFAYSDKARSVKKITQQTNIKVTVSAGVAAALIVHGSSHGQPPAGVSVTNTGIEGRTIANNLCIDLVDAYENVLTKESKLSVALSVVFADAAGGGGGGSAGAGAGAGAGAMPQLDEGVETVVQFQKGSAIVPALLIKPKSSGDDGNYAVRIAVAGKAGVMVKTLDIPFYYSNDQRRVEELSKLQARKKQKYDRLTAVNERVRVQGEQLDKAKRKVNHYKDEIDQLIRGNSGQQGAANAGDEMLDKHGLAGAIRLCEDQIRDATERSQRSSRNTPPKNPVGDNEVLGTVASFGFVEDDTMCHLISWAMQGNMNTLIVPTPGVANKHSRHRALPVTRLNKQPASLGTDRPQQAPHDAARCGGDLLMNHITLKRDERDGSNILAAKVFTQLIRQTLFFPSQEKADEYYKARKGQNVGTLYYLAGDHGRMGRIESSGVQGGRSNGPPAFEDRGFSTFAKPRSQVADRANHRKRYLQKLAEIVQNRDRAFQSEQQIKAQETEEDYTTAIEEKGRLEQEVDQIDARVAKRSRSNDDVGHGGVGGSVSRGGQGQKRSRKGR